MKAIRAEQIEKPISKIVLGTSEFRESQAELNESILDAYIAAGGRSIDTAENYGLGQSETVIGRWMQARGNRQSLQIISKGAHPYGVKRVNPKEIAHDLMGSLDRLQTDYIDIYMLHRDDPDVPVAGIVEALNEHLQAGRIRSIGVSNWSWRRIGEANAYARERGLAGVASSSINLSLAKPNEPMWADCVSADAETCRWHEETGMPLLSWSSLAGGFFSGRFSPDQDINADITRVYYSEANWERYRRARDLAGRWGCTPNQVALAYVLNQPFPTCGLIGPRSPDELAISLETLKLEMTPQEARWLDLSDEEGNGRGV